MIYRKLKTYIKETEKGITCIFGDLMSIDVKYVYNQRIVKKDFLHTEIEEDSYMCNGIYNNDHDFLLEYYVVGIFPEYKIDNSKIIPYLKVALLKEKPKESRK